MKEQFKNTENISPEITLFLYLAGNAYKKSLEKFFCFCQVKIVVVGGKLRD